MLKMYTLNVLKVNFANKRISRTPTGLRIFVNMLRLRPYLTLFALALFLIATTGIPITTHYCGGEAVDTACEPQECCQSGPSAANDEQDPCCTEEVSVASLQCFAHSTVVPRALPDIAIAAYESIYSSGPVVVGQRLLPSLGSPRAHHPPDAAFLCQFRI